MPHMTDRFRAHGRDGARPDQRLRRRMRRQLLCGRRIDTAEYRGVNTKLASDRERGVRGRTRRWRNQAIVQGALGGSGIYAGFSGLRRIAGR